MNINKFANEYIQKGDKNVGVMVLHGFTSSPSYMKAICESLNARGYWTYAPLIAGHGLSEKDLSYYDENMWLESILFATKKFRDMGVEKIFVFGHSLGGLLALRLAEMELVEGVISIVAPFKLHHKWRIKFFSFLGRNRFQPIGKKDGIENMFRYYKTSGLSISHLLKTIKKTKKNLSKVDVPVFAIYSKNDDTVHIKSEEVLLSGVSSKVKKLKRIIGEHHLCVIENINDYIDDVCSFIEENS